MSENRDAHRDPEKRVPEPERYGEAEGVESRPGSELIESLGQALHAPLESILGMTRLLLDGDLSDEQRDRCASIRESAEVLQKIAANLPGGRPPTGTGQRPRERAQDHAPEVLPCTVLVVEDNPINRKLAVRFLERRGLRTAVAENGSEALKAVSEQAFDLVLMDVQMPVMDGLAATRAIRLQEKGSGHHTPIVALTANAFDDDRKRCLEAGMDGFLAKPIRFKEFESAIRDLLATSTRGQPT